MRLWENQKINKKRILIDANSIIGMAKYPYLIEDGFPDLKYYGLLTVKANDQKTTDDYTKSKMMGIYSRSEQILTKFLFEFS